MAYFRKAILLVIIAGVSITTIAHASPPHLADDSYKASNSDLSAKTQIRFLTGTDFAPFNTLSAEGRLSGYNIDLIRAVCQVIGQKTDMTERCQVEARPWVELKTALQNNETDVLVAGLMPDIQNRNVFSFTRPYLSQPARFVSTQATQFTDKSFPPEDSTVGVLAGTSHQAMLKAYFPKLKVRPYTDKASMYQDLKQGKIPLIFGDAMGLSFWLSGKAASTSTSNGEPDGNCCHFIGGSYSAAAFLGSGMTFAIRNDDPALLAALNNALGTLERTGVLNDLYLRYFPVDFYGEIAK